MLHIYLLIKVDETRKVMKSKASTILHNSRERERERAISLRRQTDRQTTYLRVRAKHALLQLHVSRVSVVETTGSLQRYRTIATKNKNKNKKNNRTTI